MGDKILHYYKLLLFSTYFQISYHAQTQGNFLPNNYTWHKPVCELQKF